MLTDVIRSKQIALADSHKTFDEAYDAAWNGANGNDIQDILRRGFPDRHKLLDAYSAIVKLVDAKREEQYHIMIQMGS